MVTSQPHRIYFVNAKIILDKAVDLVFVVFAAFCA